MPKRSDDPRAGGGGMFDAGNPLARGQVMFDTRNAVLVEGIETAVAHTTRHGKPSEDAVALMIHGRINRPPDISGERPAERVSHLHMISWDGAADLVVDLHSLAARDGCEVQFRNSCQAKWEEQERKGLTQKAPPEEKPTP